MMCIQGRLNHPVHPRCLVSLLSLLEKASGPWQRVPIEDPFHSLWMCRHTGVCAWFACCFVDFAALATSVFVNNHYTPAKRSLMGGILFSACP